jgi:chromosome segregation ATPase
VEIEEQCKERARKIDDLTEAAEALQAKRAQLHKQATYLQEKTAEFAKLGQKAKVNLRGTDLLRKEEALADMMNGFEALTVGKN